MIGFFENIASERGIAERCNDSIAIRFFLGYDLTQSTPDHSTLSVIRDRLVEATFKGSFCWCFRPCRTTRAASRGAMSG